MIIKSSLNKGKRENSSDRNQSSGCQESGGGAKPGLHRGTRELFRGEENILHHDCGGTFDKTHRITHLKLVNKF